MKPQAYTEFQPLEEILVGRSYDKDFLESLDVPFTPTTKRLMIELLDETEEDYQNLINVLESFDVKVRRPKASAYIKSRDMHATLGTYLMNPRDDNIVIDNKIIMGQWGNTIGKGYASAIQHYKNSFLPDPAFKGLVCSSIVRLGEHIIVDSNEFANTDVHADRLKKYFEPLGYKIIYTKTHDFKFKNQISHGDAVFAILKPGLIIHARENMHYSENLFKGWDFISVEKSDNLSTRAVENDFAGFFDKKDKIRKEYSYAFEDKKYDDSKFLDLLDTWFTNLIGYSKETYFDVNCLVVNEENVIFSHYNPTIFKTVEKYGINPIICPFRHRLFWDGGIHCITSDLKRKGSRERYL